MNDNLLKRNLDYLGLPYLREEIHNLLEEAAQKRTPLGDFFEQAIASEAARRRERATERRINNAHFPYQKSLNAFN